MDFKGEMTEILKNGFNKRAALKRSCSIHVGSRWYRAPEIIMVENQYDQASDMWSLGCLMHELLQYTFKPADQFDYTKFHAHRYLFRGTSCFPLSPCKNERVNNGKEESQISQND